MRYYPLSSRNVITDITLISGFASTVGWPLTQWGIEALGWRGTCCWAFSCTACCHARGPEEAAPPLQMAPMQTSKAPQHTAPGNGVVAALGVAMLVVLAQVAVRLLEFGLLRRAPPLLSSRFATK